MPSLTQPLQVKLSLMNSRPDFRSEGNSEASIVYSFWKRTTLQSTEM